ncbi:MAG: class I SAM-dependent methyltransferase [Pontiellaceae bacterium]|jgi:SAM-dependent methyltransferase|nr:class I SAM-dependent methyltransferase [Pontiellaceae bacterium]
MHYTGNTDQSSARYWNDLAKLYQKETRISTSDFHYGPLLPGDSKLKLLPAIGTPFQCLEIGCGAGQNSIFLAKQGAQCIATDISEKQLAHGRKLAAAENVTVNFRCISMDSLREGLLREGLLPDHAFDLIHSTYALPFSADPQKVIADAAAVLKPGGTFLLTTGHPLYTGEWLDIGDGEEGLFLPDYFRPEPDVRISPDGQTLSAAQTWPASTIAEWLHSAGLLIERFLEPEPMPIPDMSEAEVRAAVPYESNGWRELYPQLTRAPIVMLFKAVHQNF